MASRRILIVDDEPKVAFFLGKTLEHTNRDYQVDIAHSGEEALEMLDGRIVDLLVTDLRMPGISGIELLRQVRTASPTTRTILITAYGSDRVEAEARRLEAYRYITKPFNLNDFTEVVQEALREVAVTQPGLVVLSDEAFETITQELATLCQDIGAQCVLLSDMLGQRLVEAGITDGVDSAALLSLLAGGFAATGALAHKFGSGQAANLNFHQGTRYEIYSASVNDNLFLAMLYERQVQASRIGIVWLYTRRSIERLLSILSKPSSGAPAQTLNEEFGVSLKAELDSLFPGLEKTEPVAEKPTPAAIETEPSIVMDAPLPVTQAQTPFANPNPENPQPEPENTIAETPSDSHAMVQETSQEPLLSLEEAVARGLVPSNLIE